METNYIIENNRLIADFMHWVGLLHGTESRALTAEDLHYHTSWDWLMTAVEKIKNDKFFASLNDNTGVSYVLDLAIDEALATANIERVYSEVAAFIRWYNEQK